jgi:hypothetical protein
MKIEFLQSLPRYLKNKQIQKGQKDVIMLRRLGGVTFHNSALTTLNSTKNGSFILR